MRTIIDRAVEILRTMDDGGLDCIKLALKEAIRIENPIFEINSRDWNYMFDEVVLRLK